MTTTIDLTRIHIGRAANEWRVWLPHSCSPDEPVGDEHDQVEWGDFYFTTYQEAADFVRLATERNPMTDTYIPDLSFDPAEGTWSSPAVITPEGEPWTVYAAHNAEGRAIAADALALVVVDGAARQLCRWDEPVPFPGTEDEARRNFGSHFWMTYEGETECDRCCSKTWHKSASYPCGVDVPRRVTYR